MIYYIYANEMNIGDYFSHKGILMIVGEKGTVLQIEQDETLIKNALSCSSQGDLFIIGGGGLLMNYFESFWAWFSDIAIEQEINYVLWGVGYCDNKDRETKADPTLLARVVEHAKAVSLRDPLSYESFSKFEHAQLVPCPAIFAIRNMYAGKIGKYESVLLSVEHPELLELLDQLGEGDRAESCGKSVRKLIDAEARKRSLKVVTTNNVLSRKRGLKQGLKQVGILRAVKRAVKSRLADFVYGYGAEGIVQRFYLPARYIVTSRLHGAIIGLALGKKVVALSGDRKIDSFYSMMGLSDWIVDNPEELKSILNKLDEQPDVSELFYEACDKNLKFFDGFKHRLQVLDKHE